MWLNLCILILLLFTCLYLEQAEFNKSISANKSVGYLIFVSSLLLILQSGLRNVAVGPDTYAYVRNFQSVMNTSWSDIFHNFTAVYVDGEGKDPGYYFLVKLFSSLLPSYRLFLIFIAIVFFTSLFSFIRNYISSKIGVLLALIAYFAIFYSFFSVTGCRQTLATALCLFSIPSIRKQNLFKFILFIAVAFTIHKSSLLFFPFYFISQVKKPSRIYFIALLCMPFLIKVSNTYAMQLVVLSGSDNYMMYVDEGTSKATVFILFYLLISTCLLFVQKDVITNKPEARLIYNAIYIAIFLLPLTYSSAALMRVVQYYSLFIIVGISYLADPSIRYKGGMLIKIILSLNVMALIYKILTSGEQYKFFWQFMELPSNY